jgi:hypothetical protein
VPCETPTDKVQHERDYHMYTHTLSLIQRVFYRFSPKPQCTLLDLLLVKLAPEYSV